MAVHAWMHACVRMRTYVQARAAAARHVCRRAQFLRANMFSFLGLKSGSEDITNAKGDLAERELAEELQNFFAKHANKNIVVLQGSAFRVPGKGKGAIEEHDFVIIDKENKLVICIECKVTLTGSTGRSAVEQTNKLQRSILLPNSPLANGALWG